MSATFRIALILGTRPEAIKLAPVILGLREAAGIDCSVCVTGQHREMLDSVLAVFGITPDMDLQLMQPDQSLAGLTARAVTAIDRYLDDARPDLVLVQGDTTTTLCGALAAFYRRIPVGHVEAGLRTWNMAAPWPEEGNRVLTSRLASLHFAPTATSRQNLLKEGVAGDTVHVTGNTGIDALLRAQQMVQAAPPEVPGLPAFLQPAQGSGPGTPPMVLITGHRRENLGEGFEQICRAITELAERFPGTHFVYPLHLNPNVRATVLPLLGRPGGTGGMLPNIHLLDPLPYLPFVGLLARATLVLTDSGGLQEEAPSLGKPVLVMRETTERPEAVDAGTVRLVGTAPDIIVHDVATLLTDARAYDRMARAINPYGDGHATPRIIAICRAALESGLAGPVLT